MKRPLFFLLITAVGLYACTDNDVSYTMIANDNTQYELSEDDIIKGRMRIKLKEEPEQAGVRSADGKISTGVRSLDDIASGLRITRMERTFPYTEKFEERTRKEGLHLWYDVWFSEEITTTRAVEEVEAIEDIEIACPVRKISSRSVSLPWNDPYLSYQWNFSNPGTENWQAAEADIRLSSDTWEKYNGDPSIIVAIVDEGIYMEHPDLQANIWTNPEEIADNGIDDDGNGYVDDVNGYNFYSGSPSMDVPYDHGTHVAGIIGAVNNNGVGVCGIAGGNGEPNSGVKLMCCQIIAYDSYNNKGAEAIKYAADNGAVICQNSWGYTGEIDPADKAAIDYFVKYAGCDNEGNQLSDSPMKGGIVLFATNNHNTSSASDATPADYENVIGVAALRPDYQKASYSDYGDYIDISAPGGERPANIMDAEGAQIYSTVEYGDYDYLFGASMACPHVSGVAALIIEKYGVEKPGFTAEQLKEILLGTAYAIDEYNPRYVGMLGSGCVNASAALSDDSPVANSQSFLIRTNPVTDGTLRFRAGSALAGDATISIYNSIGTVVLRTNIRTSQYIDSSIDISKLSAGYYTLTYEHDSNTIKEKFIKY